MYNVINDSYIFFNFIYIYQNRILKENISLLLQNCNTTVINTEYKECFF